MEKRLISKINVNCIITKASLFQSTFNKIMQIFMSSKVNQVEFTLTISSLSFSDIKKVIDITAKNNYLKDIKNDSIITFVIEAKNNQKLKKIIAPIKNNLVRLDLETNLTENPDEISIKDFEAWAYNRNGGG